MDRSPHKARPAGKTVGPARAIETDGAEPHELEQTPQFKANLLIGNLGLCCPVFLACPTCQSEVDRTGARNTPKHIQVTR